MSHEISGIRMAWNISTATLAIEENELGSPTFLWGNICNIKYYIHLKYQSLEE